MSIATTITEKEFIQKLCEATGLNYCDEDCDCGDNSELLFFPVCGDTPDWLPDWMNGVGYCEAYDWLVREAVVNAEIKAALEGVGLLPEPQVC